MVAQKGRIIRLEIENFKSYRGHQQIGPFYDFTAVVGANGSGKSNLMDAISFVLGVRTAQLRGSLKELLYSESSQERPQRGFVKLVYEDNSGDEVTFTRIIMPSGPSSDAAYQSQYRLNDRTVSLEAYNNRLKSYGILVQARNFLVFQGDIESVAALSAKDLTALIEQVSGSAAFKKEYDRCEAEKAAADEQMSFVFSKKKAVVAEKRQKKEQKEEAEKHIRMQKELDALKAEHFLWQLFHIEKDIREAQDETREQKAELNESANLLYAQEQQIEAKKKIVAGFQKERLLLERKLKKRKVDAEKKSPDVAKVKEELRRLQKRLKAGTKLVEEKQKAHKEQAQLIAKLKADLENVTDAQALLDEDMKKAAEEGQLHLDAQTQAEYYKIKEEAKSKTSKLRTDHEALKAGQDADSEALRNMEDTVKEVSERVNQLAADREELAQAAGKTRADLAAAKESLTAKKAALEKAMDANRRNGAQRDYLAQKLEEVDAQLREAKADRKESERDRRMSEAVDRLKRFFPGVYGRATELAKVTQRKYNLAMAVVMGRDLDSVICDTEATAKECIHWLRQNQVAPMTFFPLDAVRAKPVNERLRLLGGSAKVALDLLEYDSKLERAFITICGSTLVCDTVTEAKRIAFMGPERHKVVALDGTLIGKQGFITGGMSGNEAARASRWNDSALEGLKKEHARLSGDLEKLPPQREAKQAEQLLASEIAGLERDIQFKTAELQALKQKLEAAASGAEVLNREAGKKLPGAGKLRNAIAERERKMDALQARIHEVEDRIFAAFSEKVGVDNIREYMEQNSAATEDFNRRRLSLSTQAAKLKHQLTYEQRRNLGQDVKSAEAELRKVQDNLQRLQGQADAAAEASAALEGELAAESARMDELKAKAEEVETEVKAMKKEAAKQLAAGSALKNAMASHEAAIEELRTKCADILEAAQMQQVALPRKGDCMRTEEEDEDMDGDNADDAADDEDDQRSKAEGKFKLDFSGLQRQHTSARGARERDALDADFKTEIEEREKTLSKAAPNLKALQQFEAVKAQEREREEELEATRKQAKAAARAFNAVRQERYDAFTAAFEHIAAEIDPIFKDLTRSSLHPMGGTAYLSLESPDEPFLHGIKFTAMPPTKRFRDMDQLSGGEKTAAALGLLFAIRSYQPSPFEVLDEINAALDATNVARMAEYICEKTRPVIRFCSMLLIRVLCVQTVAALALLFAIHSYQPSPFFVLDEIDAALDATNVARVAEYIREKTRSKAEQRFQSIVISLKDNFYERADALVGVARDVDRCCSATYTFDLTRFETG